MSRRWPASLRLSFLLACVACGDDALAPSGARAVADAAAAAHRDVVEPAPLPLADVDVTASGPARPGMPLHVRVRVRAHRALASATLRVALPELEAARLVGWEVDSVPARVALPPILADDVRLDSGAVLVRAATVVVPVAGYYRVVAVLADTASRGGLHARDLAAAEAWVAVGEDGGAATRHHDEARMRAAGVRRPGPRYRRAPDARLAESCADCPHRPRVTDSLRVRTLYFSAEELAYRPLAGATYLAYACSPWRCTEVRRGLTDADGWYAVACTGDGTTMRGDLWAQRAGRLAIFVASGTVGPSGTESPLLSRVTTGVDPCLDADLEGGGSITRISAAPLTARAFDRLAPQVERIERDFGRPLGEQVVWISDRVAASRYRRSAREIQLAAADIPGARGEFVMPHELGHAFHDRALGNLPTGVPGSCDDHDLMSREDTRCAYMEGFADYIGQRYALRPTPYAAVILGGAPAAHGAPTYDGEQMEGFVAATLYDLTDAGVAESPYEGHDAAAFGPAYLGDVMATCRVEVGGSAYDADRLSFLLYCLEQGVDPAIAASGHYFPASPAPTAQVERATEPPDWSRAAIRTLWRYDLYSERPAGVAVAADATRPGRSP